MTSLVDIFNELQFSRVQESTSVIGGGEFIPMNDIANILTRPNLEEILRQTELPLQTLVDFVLQKASKLFVILVFAEAVEKLGELHAVGFDDDSLPIGKERPTKTEGKQSSKFQFRVFSLNRTTHNFEKHWPVFDHWPTRRIMEFERYQWQCLAPTFTDTRFFYDVHEKCPLMLVSLDDANDGEGRKPAGSAAFEKGERRCFLFPWADGGNLRDFWEEMDRTYKRRPVPPGLTSWALKQMCGLADALALLYTQNCRHGDLKPGNILHFKDGSQKGRLVIADFGLAKFHILDTKIRNEKSSLFDRTLRYEPPEMEEDNQTPRSRNYDIWSMGCILLEFSIWLVYGWEYLEKFTTTNVNEMFWEVKDENYQIHRSVQAEISNILVDLKVDAAVKDVVKLVRDQLLVIKPVNASEPSVSTRATAQELLDALNALARRASIESSYLKGPVVPKRTGMGDTLAIHGKPAIPRVSQGSLSPLDHDAGPKIIVRAATGDFGDNNQSQEPSTHPQTVSQLLLTIHYIAMLTFLVCRMTVKASNVAKTHNLTGRKLVRVESTLRAGHDGAPVISIYGDPVTNVKSQGFPQIGFPVLPNVASPQQFELLRQWLHRCDKTHDCFPRRHCDTSEMPTRVIDVGSTLHPRLRLVETRTSLKEKYIALSHCWGKLTEDQKFCAEKANMAQIKHDIDYTRLPKTFKDAVRCTRELGIQYLWIDSICIIQDDKKDWQAESQKMETVFSSAYCTIAASSSQSSIDGIFKADRKPRACVTHVSPENNTLYLCNTIDNFQEDVEQSILNTRGWVFQERALSRRTIHFTSTQVYWECGRGVRCETLGTLRK
ncbi:hypothetical protein SUNI508_13746 [Seiridium unicorne]|uniref:Protein kinase domain-containing protein n=1 Tax=Seiridium unicorne TaxID=138068 RepID=A0ABR2VBL9_9PEZI